MYIGKDTWFRFTILTALMKKKKKKKEGTLAFQCGGEKYL